METKKYNCLSYSERVKIETYLSEKKSRTEISDLLGRSKSTISREINKYAINKSGVYVAQFAQSIADSYRAYKKKDARLTHVQG